jgi:hypothetical protein
MAALEVKMEEEFESVVPIAKVNESKRVVMGEVLVPGIRDAHGDTVSAETIEKAAHAFLERGGLVGEMHRKFGGVGSVVESFIAREGDPDFTQGAWVLAVKCNEETWQKVLDGKLTGFSIGGYARRKEN